MHCNEMGKILPYHVPVICRFALPKEAYELRAGERGMSDCRESETGRDREGGTVPYLLVNTIHPNIEP